MTRPLTLTAALAALALTSALAACGDASPGETRRETPGGAVTTEGSGEDMTTTVRGENGEGAVIGSGSEAASAGPVYSRPYPGSRVVSSVITETEGAGLITFETDAQPDTVIAYYRQRMEEADLTPRADMTLGGTRHFGAESDSGGELNVVIAPQGDRSVVTVTWEGITG